MENNISKWIFMLQMRKHTAQSEWQLQIKRSHASGGRNVSNDEACSLQWVIRLERSSLQNVNFSCVAQSHKKVDRKEIFGMMKVITVWRDLKFWWPRRSSFLWYKTLRPSMRPERTWQLTFFGYRKRVHTVPAPRMPRSKMIIKNFFMFSFCDLNSIPKTSYCLTSLPHAGPSLPLPLRGIHRRTKLTKLFRCN